MKKIITALLLVSMLIAAFTTLITVSADAASVVLTTDKATYKEGEPILVTAKTANSSGKDWVGIIPKGQTDGVSIYWAYIKDMSENFDITTGKKGGSSVSAYYDLPAGEYTLVIIENDQNLNKGYATSPATLDITVVKDDEAQVVPAVLKTDKTTYTVGEKIKVTASSANTKGTDWVGIIPKGQTEGVTIYWAYIKDMSENFDITTGEKGGSSVSAYYDLPAGEYTLVIIENDLSLKKGYATAPATLDITIVAATTQIPPSDNTGSPDTSDVTSVVIAALTVTALAGGIIIKKKKIR